jgi:uncharacterized protein YndB with AHSA1/START domain
MKIKLTIQVNSSIEKVFQVFTDLEQLTQYIPTIKSVELLKGKAIMQIGTRWRETRKLFGQVATEEMEVKQLVRNKLCEIVADSHGTRYRTVYQFVGNAEGTLVELEFEAVPYGRAAKVFAWLGFLFKKATAKALQQDLQYLKLAAEK